MSYHNSNIITQIKQEERNIATRYKQARKDLARELAPYRIRVLELRIEREYEVGEALGAVSHDNVDKYKSLIKKQARLLQK